jgi:hypothetical protein
MMQEIDNTHNNLILGFAVFSFKVLAVLSMHEGLDLALTCLSIVSVLLLIVINFKKAWNIIFKKKQDEN